MQPATWWLDCELRSAALRRPCSVTTSTSVHQSSARILTADIPLGHRQEYWSGLHALLQGIYQTRKSNPHLLCLLHWQVGSFTTWEAPSFSAWGRVWRAFQETLVEKNPPANADGEGSGTPLQCSCLENPMDGGAWQAAVHGVTKSRTRLSDFTFTFHFHALEKEMATHSSVLAWRIPGTGEPGGLPSMGSHKVGHNWSDLAAAAANAEVIKEAVSIPGLGKSPGGEHSNPLQDSCLENPKDRRAWQATVHRVAEIWTWVKQLSLHTPRGMIGFLDCFLEHSCPPSVP